MLPPSRVRRAIRSARTVYLQTNVGIFRVSKAEALKVIRRDHHARALPVQQFRDSVCIGTDVDD
jgi:hypothetical protein